MSSFGKTFWAALLAFVVANVLILFIFLGVFSGMAAAFAPDEVAVEDNSILKIDLRENIINSPSQGMPNVGFSMDLSKLFSEDLTLFRALNAISMAAEDDAIKGIYINLTGAGNVSGTSMMEELRAALVKFKESGKFVVSYNENYSLGGYWLCSLSDEVIMNPSGMIDWRGMASEVMFYKGLIDKLGVHVDILRHGTYKSAVEPYMMDKMSPANRQQTQALVNSLWGTVTSDVAESRGISVDDLNRYANDLALSSAEDAKELGFVDELMYDDQVKELLAEKVDEDDVEDLEMISLGDYAANRVAVNKKISKNKVAIVYADGEIIDGTSQSGKLGGATLAKQLAQVREDDGVKAVVLRVDSPGGSALAAEVMWREIELLRAEKPVIVTMGNYAASGGYYISAPADVIICDRTTLTGSIGVFGMMISGEKALKDKLGITVDGAKTSESANMGSMFHALTPTQRSFMMKQIEQVYGTFVNRVSAGRNITPEEVDAVGQGRVWSGADAISIGLVDGFGTFTDAVTLAADRAGVASDFRVVEITEQDSPMMTFLKAAGGASLGRLKINNELGEGAEYYDRVMTMLKGQGILARMPYDIEIR